MPTTTTRGFHKYATATDPPDGPAQQNHLIDDIEALVAFRATGATLPAVAATGTVFYHSGTRTHWWSDGAAWRPVQGLPRRLITVSESLVLADTNAAVDVDSTNPVVVTVPPQSSVVWQPGTTVQITRLGTGTVTIAGGAGVVVRSVDAKLSANKRYGPLELQRLTTADEWLLLGNLA